LGIYQAYGLKIRSALALPELLAAEEDPDAPQAIVRLGSVDRPPDSAAIGGACLEATPERVSLSWGGVGLFQVQNGCEIVIEPVPQVEESALRLHLLGPVLAVLLHQRGYLVLHASSVAVNGLGVGFLGASGQGKSTLAAALHARGHALIADDVIAVDAGFPAGPRLYAGFPQIKLWPEAAVALGQDPQTLSQLHSQFQKRARRVHESFSPASYPLARLYVLAEADLPAPEIVSLSPQAGIIELVKHSFLARLLQATGSSAAHFRQCAALAQRTPVCILRRRRALADLPELARAVEVDLGHHAG
jgi:hypothetical protein